MMRTRKTLKTVALLSLALLSLSFLFGSNLAFSQTLGGDVCAQVFSPSSSGIQTYSVFNYTSSLNGMLGISLLIILVILAVVGVLYGIGYAFNIDKLVRFSKTEIGEIIVTVLIVFVFAGGFALANGISSSSTTTNPVTGANLFSSNLFGSACRTLADSSLSLIPGAIGIATQSLLYQFAQSLTISFEPNHFGVAFSPFSGIGLQVYLISIVYNLTWLLIMLLAGLAIFLYIIYAIFPLFLFAGIVLRTMPWTRAAGGAFLGMFIGFFVLLPVLLNYMLVIPASQITSFTSTTLSSELSGITSTASEQLTPSTSGQLIIGTAGIGDLVSLLSTVIFTVVGSVIAIILTIDFSETLGDFLGAPSLATSNTLKKLI